MTKRELNDDELKHTSKGIKRNIKDLNKLTSNLDYNKSLIAKQNYLREHEDQWRPYLRNKKDDEDKQIFKVIESEIENIKELIKNLQDQVNNGVEVKIPSGVK